MFGALVEGCSIRSVERLTGIHRDTITKLALRMGRASQRLLDDRIQGVRCRQLQLDEIWCFVGKKRNRVLDGLYGGRAGSASCARSA